MQRVNTPAPAVKNTELRIHAHTASRRVAERKRRKWKRGEKKTLQRLTSGGDSPAIREDQTKDFALSQPKLPPRHANRI
jgi:hypothetical protein